MAHRIMLERSREFHPGCWRKTWVFYPFITEELLVEVVDVFLCDVY